MPLGSKNWDALVDIQDRAKLDYVSPEDLMLSARAQSKADVFLIQ
jgi:hypothetical protein